MAIYINLIYEDTILVYSDASAKPIQGLNQGCRFISSKANETVLEYCDGEERLQAHHHHHLEIYAMDYSRQLEKVGGTSIVLVPKLYGSFSERR